MTILNNIVLFIDQFRIHIYIHTFLGHNMIIWKKIGRIGDYDFGNNFFLARLTLFITTLYVWIKKYLRIQAYVKSKSIYPLFDELLVSRMCLSRVKLLQVT